MANKKISELVELLTVADDDYLPIVDASESDTKKIKASNLVPSGVLTTSDIVDNLTSTDATKVLSAKQGKDLKDSADALTTRVTNVETGWLPAGETWTFASVDDPTGNITISEDVTGG